MIARMIAPIHSLGPGNRVGLWVQGCNKNCKGCMSPELQAFIEKKDIPVEILSQIIISEAKRNECRGLTISGGDPFEQPDELYSLLKEVRTTFDDILVYTGFTYEEIMGLENMDRLLKMIDVLIDGRYIENMNFGKSRLIGSNNQKIYYLNQSLQDTYQKYNSEEQQLETFIHNNKVITIGIQRRG